MIGHNYKNLFTATFQYFLINLPSTLSPKSSPRSFGKDFKALYFVTAIANFAIV
ncbi:MAG: hypothetical protein GU354_03210 [Caldimicrobium sp.]|nr:hypothetical protein [Caldimicrobium sp.]